MSKRINLLADWVMPGAFLLVTIILFFVFQPQETTALFYVNMVYTLLLEVLFFGWLRFGRKGSSDTSMIFRLVSGTLSGVYVVVGFVIMLIYGLLLASVVALKFYIVTLVVLTLLFVVATVLIAQADSDNKEDEEKATADRLTVVSLTARVNQLVDRCRQVYGDKGMTYKNENHLSTPIELLKPKISTLTPNVFRAAGNDSKFRNLLRECEEGIDAFAEAEGEEASAKAEKRLIRIVEDALREIDFIKQTTRS